MRRKLAHSVIMFGASVLLAASPAQAQFPLDGGRGFFFSGDWLSWRARRADMDFVIVDPVADTSVVGDQKSIDYDQDNGYRVSGGIRTEGGWDVWGTYTYFHSADGDAFSAPEGGQLWPTRLHPAAGLSPGINANQATFASANSSLNLEIADLGLGRSVVGTAASARIFGGFRYASIDQEFNATYSTDSVDVQVDNPHNIDAYGVRGGGEVHANLPLGFSAFGWGAGSMLIGEVHSNWTQFNTLTPGTIDVNSNYIQAIPVLEAGVGIAWIAGPMDVRFGYEFSNWFNINERTDYNSDVARQKHSRGFGDLMLDGIFVRIGVSR